MSKSSTPKAHSERWWRSLEPFDLMVMLCATLAVPCLIAYLLLSAVLYLGIIVAAIFRG